MIKVRELKTYFDSCINRLDSIKKLILVVNESQLADKIRDLKQADCPFMVLVIPSADALAKDNDNITEANSLLLYILQKASRSDLTDELELLMYEITQNAISDLKNLMLADKQNSDNGCSFLRKLNLDTFHTDPEYNYLDCYGWSLSFVVDSFGY